MASRPEYSQQSAANEDRSQDQVVITGAGVISPIGIGSAAYWEALCQQRSGVSKLPGRDGLALPLCIGGAIKDFDPKQYIKPRKALKVMCLEIQAGFAAAGLAVEQANLDASELAADRFGVVFGGEMIYCNPAEMDDVYIRCIEDGEFRLSRWGEAAMARMYPLWMLMYLPNMIACHVGIAHEARGPNNTICQGEVSSLLATIESASMILRGRADVMIAGGSSSRVGIPPFLYRGMDHLSRRIDQPADACRPFDARRDGTVNGQGAAAYLLERESSARARGAPILARVRGWGISFGSPSEQPQRHGRAIRRSIELALQHAGVGTDEVGHVNAHASGRIDLDAWEAQAIRETLGDVPVTAPKSFFGDLGSAGGAVEMLASVLALQEGQIPVTLNYTDPDPACAVRVVREQAMPAAHGTAVVLSQACTGNTAAIVLDVP